VTFALSIHGGVCGGTGSCAGGSAITHATAGATIVAASTASVRRVERVIVA
jgi:hypothetical protein